MERTLSASIGLACLLGMAGSGQAEPAAAPEPFKFEITRPDRAWSMRFGLTAQVWVVAEDSGPVGGDRESSAMVQVRRVRPTIQGTAFTSKFRYMVHVSVTPNAFEFMDLVADYAFTPTFRVRIGQWKIPFTRYRIRSYKNRQVVDWSITSQTFGAERQIGVLLHDGYDAARPPKLEWAVGLFNGVNSRTAHAIGPSRLYEPDPAPVASRGLHPELVARLGYNHAGIDTTGEGDLEGGPFRFAVSVSGAWDFAPVLAEDWAIRGAVDALVKVRGFSVSGTFYGATIQDGPSLADQQPGALGACAATGYVIGRRVEIAARYAAVFPAGDADSLQEVRGGINVFVLGRRVQWRTDAGVMFGPGGGDPYREVQVRSIVQMSL